MAGVSKEESGFVRVLVGTSVGVFSSRKAQKCLREVTEGRFEAPGLQSALWRAKFVLFPALNHTFGFKVLFS